MDFVIYERTYSRGDDDIGTPKAPPFPDAFQRMIWVKDTFNPHRVIRLGHEAYLDDDGKPAIRAKNTEGWQPKLPADWHSVGRNHSQQQMTADRMHYAREIEKVEWCLAFDTLETFIAFYQEHGIELERAWNAVEDIPCIVVDGKR